MSDELNLDSGTADLSGGVGNGQATGTGQVSESFNMDSAVNTIGDSLGFGKTGNTDDEGISATPVTPAPAAKVEPTVPVTPVVQTAADSAPKTWKAEEATAWAAIPPEAKAAIVRREEEMFKGIEQYKQTASFGTAMQNVIKPYEQLLKHHNIDPVQNTANLMNVHYVLATGSQEQKEQLFAKLAQDYGITGQGKEQQQEAYTDPQVFQLRQELAQLKAGQSSLQEARYQEVRSKTEADVNAFAVHPDNKHFDLVADDMARMLSQDKSMTMQKAYETAVWSNPVTRAKEIEAQNAVAATKASEEAAKKLAETKAALAANVRVKPKAGAATLPLGSMEDTMKATMASIKNRSN